MGKSPRIVLVMSPAWGVNHPPVGISYLKSFLEKNRQKAFCLDLSRELYERFPEKKYWDLNYPEYFIVPSLFERRVKPVLDPFIGQWAERILSLKPAAVGFSLFMSSVIASLLLARRLREMAPGLLIIGGGAEVTRYSRVFTDSLASHTGTLKEDMFATNGFDILVEGEGEYALLEILDRQRKGLDPRGSRGILYFDDRRNLVIQPARPPIADLDVVEPPDYSDFEIDKYLKDSLPIVTSRGCVHRCTFCADSPLWKNFRSRSAPRVVKELRWLKSRYGKTNFEITDSCFNGDIGRVRLICEEIVRSGLKISWSAKVAFHPGMDRELLELLRRAGCDSLAYGVESASPRVLKDMRKNPDLAAVERIIRDTSAAGVNACCFFIIGYPTETEEDFQLTLDFITRNSRYIHRFDQVTGCHIEEDSHLGHNPEAYGIVFKPDGWHSPFSTPQIRQERLARFRELARKLHTHYSCEVQS